LFSKLDEGRKDQMANFLWSIWRRKNDEIWENKDVPIEFVVRRGKEFHQSWKCAKTTKNQFGRINTQNCIIKD